MHELGTLDDQVVSLDREGSKKTNLFRSEALLLLAAAIWGFAFVAQRVGMDYVGPFTFNAARFALGTLSLVPFLAVRRRSSLRPGGRELDTSARRVLLGGGLAGLILFVGASLQQIGIVYTTAGKAGFITGLYLVIVPILGLFWRQRPGLGTWWGAFVSAVGLYLLSFGGSLAISPGDLLVLGSAFFWAGHVIVIGVLSPRIGSTTLAFLQFATCSFLSIIAAILTEVVTLLGLFGAVIPILYSGVLSVGVAYTLQVVAQRNAPPAHVAIILSLETVFAALGGRLILGEMLPLRGLFGCGLILVGIVMSQMSSRAGYKAVPTRARADQGGA